MELFPLFAMVLVVGASLSFVNARFIKLPTTIGVMLMALVMSVGLVGASHLGIPLRGVAVALLEQLHFREVLLDGMLAFLLFAGALHVDLDDLLGERLVVGVLATMGVLVSTALVGGMTFFVSRALGLGLTVLESLLFGALISPTDPIAVLGILHSSRAPKSLQVQMAGESLFNDGVGVVVFSVILGLAVGGGHGGEVSAGRVAELLLREVLGAFVLGGVSGYIAFLMLRAIDNYQVEVLITLALTTGLYALASRLHTSGPLAVVVAGLLIGNEGRSHAMSERTVQQVDTFWELIDEILNVVLFVLLGFEVLVIDFSRGVLATGGIAIVMVLLARFLSVGAVVVPLRVRHVFAPHAVKILTWGGLRGGISVALALSLGANLPGREVIVGMTYVVVIFSIAVQGLTVGKLVRASARATALGGG